MVRENLQKYLRVRSCPECGGTRLCEESRNVFIGRTSLPEVTRRSVEDALEHFETMNLTGRRGAIAEKVLKEIRARLRFLVDVGLNYLTLDRSAETLSGGEAQRIRLASQIGAGLVGVMYILDEPSIGLHQTRQRAPVEHPHTPEEPGQHACWWWNTTRKPSAAPIMSSTSGRAPACTAAGSWPAAASIAS